MQNTRIAVNLDLRFYFIILKTKEEIWVEKVEKLEFSSESSRILSHYYESLVMGNLGLLPGCHESHRPIPFFPSTALFNTFQ